MQGIRKHAIQRKKIYLGDKYHLSNGWKLTRERKGTNERLVCSLPQFKVKLPGSCVRRILLYYFLQVLFDCFCFCLLYFLNTNTFLSWPTLLIPKFNCIFFLDLLLSTQLQHQCNCVSICLTLNLPICEASPKEILHRMIYDLTFRASEVSRAF